MTEKYLMFSLEDERSRKLGEVLGNKTCKKILDFLSEQEASEKEISDKLGIPLNTVGYNIKKLKEAGLIEEKKHFWSVKGKRIPVYKILNKHIIISPKKSPRNLGSVLPVVLVAAIFSSFIWFYNKAGLLANKVGEKMLDATPQAAESLSGAGEEMVNSTSAGFSLGIIGYFLIGIWAIIVIFAVYSWKSKR